MRSELDEDFARWVEARQHVLLRAAYLVCGDAHLAEDLLQGAFVKVAQRWERLRHENPDAYVRRILYRDAVSSWRRTRREVSAGADGVADPVERDGAPDAGQRVDLLRALAELTPKQRAVVVLRFFEDRSEAQAAEVLGVSVGTVKSQTHAALGRLRVLLPDFAPHAISKDQP